MSYQALLFCPDEKTARSVTQVLSELEFEVDACAETFAAVKKLMGAHFDAVVVDCDNEQNATLLFKSARNSAANQASLAVAVVEGQAGVAKAFRIGANLVLTKPINVEQAKGTLRVARGLLRKGEPAKPAPAAETPSAQPDRPSAPPPAAAKTATPTITPKPAPPAPKPLIPAQAPPSMGRPVAKTALPTPGAAAKTVAATHESAAQVEEIPEISLHDSASTPEPAHAKAAQPPLAAPKLPVAPAAAATKTTEAGTTQARVAPKVTPKAMPPMRPAAMAGSRAASAPAPARIAPAPVPEAPAAKVIEENVPASSAPAEEITAPAEALPTQAASTQAALAGDAQAHTFTFGGANTPETEGGSKKILLIVAVIALIAAGAYFGWTYYQEHGGNLSLKGLQTVASPQAQPPAHPVPTSNPVATAPPSSQPAASAPASGTNDGAADSIAASDAADTPAAPATSKPAVSAATRASAPAPLVVKGGAEPAVSAKTSVPDAPAPSMLGIAAGGELPPNVGSSTGIGARPILQRLNISQGVSQGLLIKKVQPIYPRSALAMRMEGTVDLMATITKTGDVSGVKIVSGDEQFNKAASDAVKQWKYKPYLLNGEPVEIQTPITIKFKLPN